MSTLTTTAPAQALDRADPAHDLLTREEVAAILRVHPNTVSLISDELPPLRIASRVLRWRRRDVEAYLDRLATAG